MKERPILFSGPMVRAILEGWKTQTRRVIKPQPDKRYYIRQRDADPDNDIVPAGEIWLCEWDGDEHGGMELHQRTLHCPYGQPGERLWVRETWLHDGPRLVRYRADGPNASPQQWDCPEAVWHPSIHMPRAYSRITLEITDVRVERVQEISEADAWEEGAHAIARTLPYSGDDLGRVAFSGLWEEVNGKRPGCSWDDNPWVWALTFKPVDLPNHLTNQATPLPNAVG